MPSKKGIHFDISERKLLLRIIDILSILSLLYVVSLLFDFDYFTINKENWTWILVFAIYIWIFGTVFELYDLQKASQLETVIPNVILTASVTVLFYLFTPFFTPSLPDERSQIIYFFLGILVALFLWRYIYLTVIDSPRFYKKVLIVGETSNIETIIQAFNRADPNYKVIGFINCEYSTEDTIKYKGVKEYKPEKLHDIIIEEHVSEIVVASYNSESITPEIYHDLIMLLETGFPIKEYTQVYEDLTQRVPVQFVGKDFYKYFPFSRSNQNKFYLFSRRVFDIIFSVIGLVIGIAILPLILIGNLIANRGPLLYFQERIGKNTEIFRIVKFRTMIQNAEDDIAIWAEKNDVRVTPFGKFLRRSRLDEIPQFYNIIKGEMSLIGPRPERPHFVRELSQSIPFYETRHIIKPGLTGWAQVKVRYGSTIDDSLLKLQYDLYYIKHRSFFLDANILIKTFSTVLFFRGQ